MLCGFGQKHGLKDRPGTLLRCGVGLDQETKDEAPSTKKTTWFAVLSEGKTHLYSIQIVPICLWATTPMSERILVRYDPDADQISCRVYAPPLLAFPASLFSLPRAVQTPRAVLGGCDNTRSADVPCFVSRQEQSGHGVDEATSAELPRQETPTRGLSFRGSSIV